jgi:TonB family protein
VISLLAAMLLQADAQAPGLPPPPPPPSPPPVRGEPARAKANLASLISNDDYPIEALRNEEEGTVGFMLRVGTDGLVEKCTVTSPSGSAALDSATCNLLTERARFTPARNKRGKPIPDTVAARIIWRIDNSGPATPLAPLRFANTIYIGRSGEPSCTQAVNFEPEEPAPCPSTLVGSLIDAARAAGHEVKQLLVTTMTPEGQAEPPVPPDDGTQIMIVEARIRTTADGMILECREVRAEAMGIAVGRPPPPGACGQFAPGNRLFSSNAAVEVPITVEYRARSWIVISD